MLDRRAPHLLWIAQARRGVSARQASGDRPRPSAARVAIPMSEKPSAAVLPEGLLYVDGVLRRAEGGKTYDNIGPWTGQPVGIAADASANDVEEAIAAAR